MPKVVFILLLALGTAASAQPADPLPFPQPAAVPVLSGEASASMLTMMPGEEVYSLFGHTAVRVRDPAIELDRTYNYGVFDFDQPNFLLRFLRGQTDYQLATATFDRTLAEYRFLDRPVVEQRLDLAPADLQALFLFLETNHLPENRVYRYDFIFDNCSTRPRDALEWALGERFSLDAYAPPKGTFRELIGPYSAAAPLTDFGIGLGFGRPVDREPTPREAVFLPIELFRALEEATLDGRPLVAGTDTLFWVPGAGLPDPAPDYPAIFATLLLLLAIGLTLWHGSPEVARKTLDAAVMGFAGLLGIVLALLWLATEHHVTRINPDLLWAWPTHAGMAILLLRDVHGPRMRVYLAASAAAAGAAGLLGVIGLLAMHAAAVPLALVIAIRCAARARPPTAERAHERDGRDAPVVTASG